MKKGIFIISILVLFIGCVNSLKKENTILIRVDTGYGERTGKDYLRCWVNDSLMFSGVYVNRFNDITLEHMEECYGMEVVRMDKENLDSIKIKVRIISLDSISYEGKKVIDTTFMYRIDNIPEVVISCRSNCGYLIWDNLRTPDFFEYEY